VWVGANVKAASGGVEITHVFAGGAALTAGVSAGDTVIAVDYVAVTAESLPKELIRRQTEEFITLHYFRLGELHVTSLPVVVPPLDTAVLSIDDETKVSAWLTQ